MIILIEIMFVIWLAMGKRRQIVVRLGQSTVIRQQHTTVILVFKLSATAQMVKNCHVLVDYLLMESIICVIIVVRHCDCLVFATQISVVIIYANYPLIWLN